jgi:tetratricopeptide (TPR) repeat protein
MINLKQELLNFPQIDTKNFSTGLTDVPDNILNSVILYNKALENLRLDSEDIAIIELKKAISMNPHFHEAMNLLGICYSYIKDNTKAIEMFEKVVVAENNSIIALKYLNLITSNEVSTSSTEKKKKRTRTPAKNDSNELETPVSFFKSLLDIKRSGKNDILRYALIFIAGMLLMFVINAVVLSGKGEKPATDSIKQLSAADNIFEKKYNDLNMDFNKLQNELIAANSELSYDKNVIKLSDIEKSISNKKYEDAADSLIVLKDFVFKDADKTRFDTLYSDTMAKAAPAIFTEGINLMAENKFQDALNKLNKIQVYKNDWTRLDNVFYDIGTCYSELNDIQNAVLSYRRVINEYPKSRFASWAANRIKIIGGEP